jgi:hypothetical protein
MQLQDGKGPLPVAGSCDRDAEAGQAGSYSGCPASKFYSSVGRVTKSQQAKGPKPFMLFRRQLPSLGPMRLLLAADDFRQDFAVGFHEVDWL